jgi:hypothetical protein
MRQLHDSTDRPPLDYVMFGLAFVAFMVGVSAVVVAARDIAIVGAVVLVLTILSFRFRAWVNEL